MVGVSPRIWSANTNSLDQVRTPMLGSIFGEKIQQDIQTLFCLPEQSWDKALLVGEMHHPHTHDRNVPGKHTSQELRLAISQTGFGTITKTCSVRPQGWRGMKDPRIARVSKISFKLLLPDF